MCVERTGEIEVCSRCSRTRLVRRVMCPAQFVGRNTVLGLQLAGKTRQRDGVCGDTLPLSLGELVYADVIVVGQRHEVGVLVVDALRVAPDFARQRSHRPRHPLGHDLAHEKGFRLVDAVRHAARDKVGCRIVVLRIRHRAFAQIDDHVIRSVVQRPRGDFGAHGVDYEPFPFGVLERERRIPFDCVQPVRAPVGSRHPAPDGT